jgi:hypothetical protein
MSISQKIEYNYDIIKLNIGKMNPRDFNDKYVNETAEAKKRLNANNINPSLRDNFIKQSGCDIVKSPPTQYNGTRLYVEERPRLFEYIFRRETYEGFKDDKE